jgi:hypothetical protein
MKTTEEFKKVIQAKLEEMAKMDALFAKTLQKKNKNIDDCCTYILNTVQKSGCSGFADDEIFSMAAHYYDEDSIKVGEPVNCKVVVNHHIEKPKQTSAESPKVTPKVTPKVEPKKEGKVISIKPPKEETKEEVGTQFKLF